jgi:hypothetical protein
LVRSGPGQETNERAGEIASPFLVLLCFYVRSQASIFFMKQFSSGQMPYIFEQASPAALLPDMEITENYAIPQVQFTSKKNQRKQWPS